MPLHRIYHHPSVFSDEDKSAIAERITACYYPLLPAFYVVVLFIPVEGISFYKGGKPTSKLVRIVSQHLARQIPTSELKAEFVLKLESTWAPFIQEKGLDWVLHIEEHDRELWRSNGLIPPMPETQAEKLWVKENKPIPYY